MSDTPLTSERVLAAAEEVLRRYGPAKATVVDVARALGVSHASVYKHFPSKAALRDGVVQIWMDRFTESLQEIVDESGPAAPRLHRWLLALIHAKRSRASDDPEMFATYCGLAQDAREVVGEHVKHLASQITQIISDGVKSGEFQSPNPAAIGRAVLAATARFHHPAHASEWSDPDIDANFEEVWGLILCGLQSSLTPKQ